MKTALLCFVWLWLVGPVAAQEFTLESFAVSSGGGESSGGDFELSATVGESGTGSFSGGDFDLSGGFWSIITVVETPDAPRLNVIVAGGQALISWPQSTTTAFTLEEASILANPSGNTTWAPVNVTPNASNGLKSVQLPLSAGHRFYRLHKP